MAKAICNHFALGFVAGKIKICRLEFLPDYIAQLAFLYYVGSEDRPPKEHLVKMLKNFQKFKYCPLCGKKLDFQKVKEELSI